MISSPTTISPEFFKTVNSDVSSHIKKKLRAMDVDVTALELHNSSLTKTFRVYLTVSRAVNLKTLYMAEQIVCQEIEKHFAFRPHAFYWCYRPDSTEPHDLKNG
jgi:hypothetical protein